MDKIKIKEQEFEGFLFDGKLDSAVEIIKEIKNFPHSTMVKCDINVDPDLNNLVLHIYLVNGGVVYHPNGQPVNVVYYAVGQGECVVFAGKVITVINHKLLAPLGVMLGERSAAEVDRDNAAIGEFEAFPETFGDEEDEEFELDDDRFLDREH